MTVHRRTEQPLAKRPGRAPAARPYLEEVTLVRVRFHEVDALHIVWHGHYVTYFEEARRAFGRRYGLDYPVFLEQQLAVPIVELAVNYLAPARMNDVLEVKARLFRSDAAKLEFAYEVRESAGKRLLATGSTVQAFTTLAGELILQSPRLLVERYRDWESLWIRP